MDCSNEYIKMCEMAMDDLQIHWKGKQGDLLYLPHKKKTYVAYMTVYGEFNMPQEVHFFDDEINGDSYSFIGDYIPLLRQDQLQDMMIDRFQEHKYPLWQMMYSFNNFIACPPLRHRKKYVDWLRKYVTQFTTLEQLWLAFVMERKFKKVWNGEDWVVA